MVNMIKSYARSPLWRGGECTGGGWRAFIRLTEQVLCYTPCTFKKACPPIPLTISSEAEILKMKKGSTERPVKPTSFEFITFSNLSRMRDAAAKSQIRKHAMKDIGVTRRRPDKRRRGCIEVPLELLPRMAAPSPVVTSIGYAAIDPFLKYPVELDHVGKELVANSKSIAVLSVRWT